MKLSISLLCTTAISGTSAFIVQPTQYATSSISLNAEPEKFKAVAAEIRGPTEKNAVLEFGWDGTTALGGAVVDSQPARMLDEILENGETQSEACELFNANLGKFYVLCCCCISLSVYFELVEFVPNCQDKHIIGVGHYGDRRRHFYLHI